PLSCSRTSRGTVRLLPCETQKMACAATNPASWAASFIAHLLAAGAKSFVGADTTPGQAIPEQQFTPAGAPPRPRSPPSPPARAPAPAGPPRPRPAPWGGGARRSPRASPATAPGRRPPPAGPPATPAGGSGAAPPPAPPPAAGAPRG